MHSLRVDGVVQELVCTRWHHTQDTGAKKRTPIGTERPGQTATHSPNIGGVINLVRKKVNGMAIRRKKNLVDVAVSQSLHPVHPPITRGTA